jgi:ribosome maturation factor RimP
LGKSWHAGSFFGVVLVADDLVIRPGFFIAGRLSEVGSARFFFMSAMKPPNVTLQSDRVSFSTGFFEMSQMVIDKVQGFLQILLPTLGLELFEVQFRKEGHGWVLRVFIDSEAGVTLQHCSDVSRELGHHLDIEDYIDHAYHLEVSSPGLERPLRTIGDFLRFQGKKARVKLHNQMEERKVLEGVIEAVNEELILLRLADGGSVQFSVGMMNKARLTI